MDKFDAMAALGLSDDEGASWALMVPTMMHRIMALKPSARACHDLSRWAMVVHTAAPMAPRSEEHPSELQSLMRISYAVFCLKKKKNTTPTTRPIAHTHISKKH